MEPSVEMELLDSLEIDRITGGVTSGPGDRTCTDTQDGRVVDINVAKAVDAVR